LSRLTRGSDNAGHMASPRSSEPQAEAFGRKAAAGSPTRGFLFADLRDYTRYVEEHGAADAASLLVRYRTLVRSSVAKHDSSSLAAHAQN
jgi:class 3 adenylate cyclase